MHIKKNLAIAAAVAVLAVPALGATNANVHVHADSYDTTGYIPSQNRPKPFKQAWDNIPGVGEDQGDSSFNKKVGAVSADPNTKPVTVIRNGHTMTVVPYSQIPGKIIKVDGQPVTSKAQVLSMLSKSVTNNNKLTQSTTSNTDNIQAANNTQNGKLAQTGESNTGAKAGIVGTIAAMVSVAFASVEKFFKRA